MMNGLRMIWVISRHYNCEERMAPLMETIANTLVRQPCHILLLTNSLTYPGLPYPTLPTLISPTFI